jgi:hypothetical protein
MLNKSLRDILSGPNLKLVPVVFVPIVCTKYDPSQIEVSTGIHGAQGMLPIPLHERMLEKIKYDKEATGEPVSELLNRLKVAQGDSVPGEAMAFYRTWLEFVDKHKDPAAIILLVYPVKRSSYSHFQLLKWLQFKLEDVARKEGTGRPRYVQLTFAECHERSAIKNVHC